MDKSVTAADKLIWGIPSGARLTCKKSLVMEGDGITAFTAGEIYTDVSMHPIAEPAFIRMVDDQGESHQLNGDHVAEYFNRF